MKIVVLGGTGLIGSQVTRRLRSMGQAVISASRSSGVDVVTGDGLDRALDGADAVIDVTNVGSDATDRAGDFFAAASETISAAERRAGIAHHIALSIVGADRAGARGYFRAKAQQEAAVEAAHVPYSILRSTQFFEFADLIADWNTTEDTVRLPATAVRPLASDDVVTALVSLVRGAPLLAATEIAGPEEIALDEFVRRVLRSHHDERYVVRDDAARPHGFDLEATVLAPTPDATRTQTTLADWIAHRATPAVEGRHAAAFSFSDVPE